MIFHILYIIVIIIQLILLIQSELWNITTDPLPPLQPKEVGVETYNLQLYYLASNDENVLNVEVPGYQFSSYSQLTIQSISGGDVNGMPNLQIAYDNYLNPSSSTASMLVHYGDQTCTTGAIEGYEPYPGYDYYQTFIIQLYESGIPIYFRYVESVEYGLCLQYSATPPWVAVDDDEPRVITYTLTFQNSTGYLLTYALVGTEYCCPVENFYCPNNGLCNDGTMPQLTNANTTQILSNYQLFTANSWPSGFFGAYCPFTTLDSNDDDSNNSSSNGKGLSVQTAIAILFGVLFGFACIIIYGLYQKLQYYEKAAALNIQSNSSSTLSPNIHL